MSTTAIQLSRASATVRSRSTRRALAHVEGRRLVTHPIFLFGMLVTAAPMLAVGEGPPHPSILFVVEGGICTFLLTFLASSREQRDHAHDIYRAQPASSRLRTEAALLSLAYAAAAGAALVLALALTGTGPAWPAGDRGLEALRPLALLEGGLYYALAGALGVLVGTWTRHIRAAAVAAVVLYVSPLTLSSTLSLEPLMRGNLEVLSGENAIHVVMSLSGQDLPFVLTASGLTALAAASALARHDRRPRIVMLALVGLCAIGGVVAMAIAAGAALIVLLWPKSPNLAESPEG